MSKIKVDNEEDLKSLKEIEETVLKDVNLGFDPEVLGILDSEEATPVQIEALKGMISPEIVARLYSLGNSTYYGRLGAGKFLNFFEVILRLGMQPAKVYILSLALFFFRPEREFMILAARSFITSVLGRMLAKQMGMSAESVKKVELGGLFLEVGKVFLLLYEEKTGNKLDKDFIRQYFRFLGVRVVEIFKLPEFLTEILSTTFFTLRSSSFAWPSIVNLAHAVVDKNFQEHGKFVLQTSMPDAEGLVVRTYGSMIVSQLEAVGLGSFLEIISTLSRTQQIHQEKKEILKKKR